VWVTHILWVVLVGQGVVLRTVSGVLGHGVAVMCLVGAA
jgi:hypothetical protein